MDTYTSMFENSEILEVEYCQEKDPEGKAGTVKQAIFKIVGREFMAHDNLMQHSFNFIPSVSILSILIKKQILISVTAYFRKTALN